MSAPPRLVRVVVTALLRSVAVPLVVMAALSLLIAVIALLSGDPALLALLALLVVHVVGGLLASFLVHEVAHVLALARLSGVDGMRVATKGFRFSIEPRGVMSGRQMTAVALAGPVSCVVVGVVLQSVLPATRLAIWYLPHALLLLPCFGDGRALVAGLRSWSTPVRVGS